MATVKSRKTRRLSCFFFLGVLVVLVFREASSRAKFAAVIPRQWHGERRVTTVVGVVSSSKKTLRLTSCDGTKRAPQQTNMCISLTTAGWGCTCFIHCGHKGDDSHMEMFMKRRCPR